mgnify:CR=1 FL=1|jgi:hypothetical protein
MDRDRNGHDGRNKQEWTAEWTMDDGTMDRDRNGHVQQVTLFVPVHSSIKRQVHRVHDVHDVPSCPCPLKTLILPFE